MRSSSTLDMRILRPHLLSSMAQTDWPFLIHPSLRMWSPLFSCRCHLWCDLYLCFTLLPGTPPPVHDPKAHIKPAGGGAWGRHVSPSFARARMVQGQDCKHCICLKSALPFFASHCNCLFVCALHAGNCRAAPAAGQHVVQWLAENRLGGMIAGWWQFLT